MVAALANHTFYSAIDNQHCAGSARGHTAIESRSINGDSHFGSLTDCVLFGMYCSDTMCGNIAVFMQHFLELMSNFVTVRKARRSAYITGYQYLFVFGNYTTGTATVTGSPFGNRFTDFHKIFIPAWSFVLAHNNLC
jgi:hypothetical protein